MQITCDTCHTTYRVNAHLIGETGRKVRCTACGAIWSAPPASAADLAHDQKIPAHDLPPPGQAAEKEPAPEDLMFIVEEAKQEPPPARPEWDVEEEEHADQIDEILSFRSTAEQNRPPIDIPELDIPEGLRSLQAMKAPDPLRSVPRDFDTPPVLDARPFGLGAASFGLSIFLLLSFTSLLSLVAAKGPITRAAPVMAGLYKAIGLHVAAPGEGFSIANMTADLHIDGVLRTLTVGARLSNISQDRMDSPVMRVIVRDEGGDALKSLSFAPEEDKQIGSGEEAPVSFSIKDVPPAAKTAELTIVDQ